MSLLTLLLIAAGIVALGLLLYWQLIVAEGTYLGTTVVTLLYDIVAGRYDRIKGFDADDETRFLGKPLATVLEAVPAPFVLDVATGTGRVALALLAQPAFNGRIVGLDSARRMLDIAAQKVAPYGNRVELLWHDAASLPFPDATFDAVTCLEMLEFTPDPAAQLAELVRVLRPRGLLLTTRRRGFDARLMPGKTYSREQMTAMLNGLNMDKVRIHPWQVDYDMVWAVRSGQLSKGMGGLRPLVEVLRCPTCASVAWQREDSGLTCSHCGTHFPARGSVLELRGATRQQEAHQ